MHFTLCNIQRSSSTHMDIHKHARIHTFRVHVSLSDWFTHCSANCLPSSVQSLTFSPYLSQSSLKVKALYDKHIQYSFTLKHQSFECLFGSSQVLHPYFSISELPQLLPSPINHPTSLKQEMLKTKG